MTNRINRYWTSGQPARPPAGRVAIHIDRARPAGAIVEVRCANTSIVASADFVRLADELARQVVVGDPGTVANLLAQASVEDPAKSVGERIADVARGEAVTLARFTRLTGLLGQYVHHDGSVGVLVQVEGAAADAGLLRDVAMHATAKNPLAVAREYVDPAVVKKEIELARSLAVHRGQPPHLVEEFVARQMRTFFAENVLAEQPFIKDDSKSVGDLLAAAGLKLVRFARYRVDPLS